MQKLQTRNNFCCIESRACLWEPAALLDVEHQITAVQVLHHEEKVRLKHAVL